MKIAFLLPTVRFGKDGIADYTRRLAGWCEEQCHETRLIPLGRNDWLKRGREYKARMREVQNEIHEFSPDVLSWQFDGQSFHPIAIFPTSVVPKFEAPNAVVHLMGHETWATPERHAGFLRRAKSRMQRFCVSRAIQKINPSVCHTSNDLYIEHLKGCGYQASLMPLFSGVAVDRDFPAEKDYTAEVIKLVFFGVFHDHWNPSEFLETLRESGGKFKIHHVGRVTPPEDLIPLKKGCEGWAELTCHGALPETEVSHILSNAHFAVSTYHLPHLGKSSVYAAFLDHGLPVISPRTDHPEDLPIPENIILWSSPVPDLRNFKRFHLRNSIARSGGIFLGSLGHDTVDFDETG